MVENDTNNKNEENDNESIRDENQHYEKKPILQKITKEHDVRRSTRQTHSPKWQNTTL